MRISDGRCNLNIEAYRSVDEKTGIARLNLDIRDSLNSGVYGYVQTPDDADAMFDMFLRQIEGSIRMQFGIQPRRAKPQPAPVQVIEVHTFQKLRAPGDKKPRKPESKGA